MNFAECSIESMPRSVIKNDSLKSEVLGENKHPKEEVWKGSAVMMMLIMVKKELGRKKFPS